MKSIFIFFMLLGFCNVLLAQGPARGPASVTAAEGNTKITGIVMDSLTQKPVEFATVALTNAETGAPVDGAVCDEKGKFTINKVALGSYKVVISFIGFETKAIAVKIDDKKDDVDLGTIIISPSPKLLQEITVEGQKAIIEERVDRTVYNAENDVTAKGGDATDVLKRVPLLSVDLDGNVSMRGNQNVKVLINNKPSTIMASSIADALKQIPADMIKSVEVITSPSAKYDAEGSAGIINIITKKNTLEGLTLNINAGAGLRGSNLGLNGNYRKGKLGLSLGGFGRANYNINGEFNSRQIVKNEDGTVLSENIQQAETRNRGIFGNYQLGWDYDINKRNYIAGSVRYGIRSGHNFQDGLRTERNGVPASMFSDINSTNQSGTVDVDFTYTKTFEKPQKEFSILALYSRNDLNNNFENIRFNTSDEAIDGKIKNENQSFNQEITIQADYVTPVNSTQMIEFGAKDIMRKVTSDYRYLSAGADGIYSPSTLATQPSNIFNYDQNVTSGYFSYTLNTKASYSFKAGARYEYTTIDANFQDESEDVSEIPSYGVLVPSVNISKKLKNGKTLKLSYNRRIQRPSIQFLNPNRPAANELDVTVGNPTLGPEYTNNYELSYSTFIKGTTLNFSAFMRNTNNAIQSLREPVGTIGAVQTSYYNIGQEDAYGLSMFANVNIGNKLSLNGGADSYYSMLDNNNPNPQYSASNEGWVVSGRLFGNYNLSKGWGFQFFSFFRGNQVQLQGKQSGFRMYSLGIKKDFNEKRGSFGIAAENFVTPSITLKGEVISPQAERYTTTVLYNMGIRLNFSYRIGKMTLNNAPKRRRTVNNDDLKDGGGGDNTQGTDAAQQPQRGTGQAPATTQQRGTPGQTQPQSRTQNNPQQDKNVQGQQATPATVYEATGTWTYTIDSPQGGEGTIILKKENDVYSGTIKNGRMPEAVALVNVIVNQNNISFSYPMNFGGNAASVEVKYTITNNEIQGTMSIGEFRTFNLTGKRAN